MLDIATIQKQIQSEITDQTVKIVDESHLHKSHQRFQSEKAYLLIILETAIHSNRLANHRRIYKIVERHCPKPIHALRIQITQ